MTNAEIVRFNTRVVLSFVGVCFAAAIAIVIFGLPGACPPPASQSAPVLGSVHVESLDDATVACLRAGGAAAVPGDGVEAVYGPVSLIRACGAVPAGWSAA